MRIENSLQIWIHKLKSNIQIEKKCIEHVSLKAEKNVSLQVVQIVVLHFNVNLLILIFYASISYND